MKEKAAESRNKILEAQRWDRIIPRLVEYARARIRARIWAGRRDGLLPGGQEAEDVVYGAIEKVLEGRRVWDPEAKPDLEAYLRDVIESDLNHLAVGFENRRFLPASQVGSVGGDDDPVPLVERVASPHPAPSARVEEDEEKREAEGFRRAFLETLADEPDMKTVVEGIFEGVEKPGELAARAGVSAKEIYNMRRKLQRRLLDFYGKWAKAHEGGEVR